MSAEIDNNQKQSCQRQIRQTKCYRKFSEAAARISGIAPIDYFFANELTTATAANELTADEKEVWYHLLIALSASVRDGHTCLPLTHVAGQQFGLASDDNVITHHGFSFPNDKQLLTLLAKIPFLAASELAVTQPNISNAEKAEVNVDGTLAVVFEHNCLYMRRNYQFEKELKLALVEKTQLTLDYTQAAITDVVDSLFPENEAKEPNQASQATGARQAPEVDWQKLAVANSVNKGLSIIAGGPGTGKTYTVTKLLAALSMLSQSRLDIALVAPTGKAAQRLSESIQNAVTGFRGVIADNVLDVIPSKAQTLHRLLGVIPNQVNFRKGSDNPLDYDVIIIDEVSMVDLPLMARLFRAIPAKCQVIMLGDADQLPSVALGSVLADIAVRPHLGYSKANLNYLAKVCQLSSEQAKQLPKAKKQVADHLSMLLKSRRFDGEGAIGNIAMATIAGEALQSWQYISVNSTSRDDITLLPPVMTQWLNQYVKRYYQPVLEAENITQAFERMSQFRILCATRVGNDGVEAINQQIISLLKGNYQQDKLFHGLPIMINENHYGLGLYNGDIGIIWKNAQGHLVAYFEDTAINEGGVSSNNRTPGFKTIIPSRLPSFEPVFAMTIHKTQGSEFEHVVMVLPNKADNQLLTRELIYTGVTRAKKKLSLSCSEPVWYRGVDAKVERYSNLSI
ncbi:exodeoxyribonuclease V subunit alpha [Thalassotalea montiporae]